MKAIKQSKLFERLPENLRAKLRRQRNPAWVPPMLATLTGEAFSRPGWLFEPKLDGERCLGLCSHRHVRLISRNQKPLNSKYPELVKALESQPVASFAVDGEIVAFDGDVTSFAELQQRMQVQHPAEELRKRVPVWFYVFDVLMLEGFDTRPLPLRARKRLLAEAFHFKDPLRSIEYRESEGEAYFEEACRKGWEGILAKAADSAYLSRRSGDWLKFKCINEQEFVIGGYTDPKGSRVGFGALLVGYNESGKLAYAGKVGTGYDTNTLEILHAKLRKLETRSSPFASDGGSERGVHWVTPKLVAQIGFAEWTRDGKLRQPRFLGLRLDKQAKEVVRERAEARRRN
jgi:bifunctional non-homologous end joining protein LigD